MSQPPTPGSPNRPLRVAIIGSGPAGFYAADALFKLKEVVVEVDVFDRLPTPYGLVRAGVAPDHQNVKKVVRVFDRTAANERFRFIGNVRLGAQLHVADLLEHYDQIVYAVGAEAGRELHVPGRGAKRYHPASVIVGWYNGHPDYQRATYDLSVKRVAIIGNGNVALDVSRIFAKNNEELRQTDIADHALEVLTHKQITDIYVIGRGDPLRASFTPSELKEYADLRAACPVVDPADVAPTEAFEAALARADKRQQRNVELLREYAAGTPRERCVHVHFLFGSVTREVLVDEEGTVRGLKLERAVTRHPPEGSRLEPTGEVFELDVEMVIPAVGYQTEPIPGVPFDEATHRIANLDGRVIEGDRVVPNQYVVGWARTGPHGVIGTHKVASREVVARMMEDRAAGSVVVRTLPPKAFILEVLAERGVATVSFADWKLLDTLEVSRGEVRGAPRLKFAGVDSMLDAVKKG